MPTSLGVARGELLFAQINKLDANGVALVTATDSIVFAGNAIEEMARSFDVETVQRQADGATTIAESQTIKGGWLDVTFGSDEQFDLDVMLGNATSLLNAGASFGMQDNAFGSSQNCPCGVGSTTGFAFTRWHKAYQCDSCVGLWVEVYPKVVVNQQPTEDQYRRTAPLRTKKWRFQYLGNTGFARGPGKILPGTALTPASTANASGSGVTAGLPRYTFVQSSNSAVSPLGLKFPYAAAGAGGVAGCQTCGTVADGLLSSTNAVGGTGNDGNTAGLNGYY